MLAMLECVACVMQWSLILINHAREANLHTRFGPRREGYRLVTGVHVDMNIVDIANRADAEGNPVVSPNDLCTSSYTIKTPHNMSHNSHS